MRLPRHHDLERALVVSQQPCEPGVIAQDQVGALVRREPPREADRERLRIERSGQPARAHEAKQRASRIALHAPERLVVQLVRPGEVRCSHVLLGAEQDVELVGDPRACVHAVRHRADRHLGSGTAGPETLPHLARHLAVQRGDAVRICRRAQRERRQAESALVRLGPSERDELVPGEAAALDELGDVSLDECGIEHLVPRRHGRVRREDCRRAKPLQRRFSRQAPILDELAQALQLEKCGVALVQVEDGRVDTELAKHAHARDAEHELLVQAVLTVAAVELVGDRPGPVRVALDVGVEQVEGGASDLHAPDPCADGDEPARFVRELDDRAQLLEKDRQALGIVVRIALGLPIARVEPLPEVPVAVEQTDRDERHAEIRRRLQVVAGEHAEPARVDRQALVEPELAGEVRDAEPVVLAPALPPRSARCFRLELREHPLDALQEPGTRACRELRVGELREQRARIVVQRGEALLVELFEECARSGEPGEPEVAGDGRECGGDGGK